MGRMARSLTPVDAGYAALLWSVDPEVVAPVEIVFDAADWRFELGSWAATPAPVKFDPTVCALAPEELGFVAGWSKAGA